MPALKNPRHELFALELAKGTQQTDAFERAGFKREPKNAARLARRPEVFARYEELRNDVTRIEGRVLEKAVEKLADKLVATREWIIDKLVQNVERAMQARAVLDSDGRPTGEFRYDGTVANRALELLGKQIGMFVERRENLNVHYSISDKPPTADEWAERYAEGVGPTNGATGRAH